MKSADEFLGLFSGVKKTGQGLWNVRCPSHNDGDKPDHFSLSVKELPDKILIHCHAGCNYKAVLKALKLTESDLFFDNPKANTSPLDKGGKIVAVYDYLDENGKLLHQTVRFEPKKFSQRRPGKKDEWIWNLRGVNPVIYQLPRVKEAIAKGAIIYLPEGEKDVDNLASHLGLVATTGPMGAGKWRKGYAQMLSGAKEVVVIADNDPPGLRHAKAIAASLLAVQVPTKLLEMPAADIKDISDWISAGLTADQFKEIIGGLPPYEPPLAPIDSVGKFRLTDLGNAERLIHQFGDILHYSYERKRWLIWNGKVWEWDMGDKIMQLATKTVRDIYHEVADEPEDKKRKELTDHAKRSESDQRLEAMIKQAKARQGIPVGVEKLNTDAWLLNCSNGTINLKTGKLQPHNKKDLITMLIPLPYHAEARSEEWDSFLGTIFEQKDSIISYVQKALGYSITGSQEEQAFFFCHGSGWNGKSTLLGAVTDVLGPYAQEIEPEVFMVKHGAGGPNEAIASLYNKRFVCSTEVEDDQKLSVTLIKRMTGGEKLRHERKYEHGFDFLPLFKLWLSGNHEPVITDPTNSIWNRLKRIPFKVSFSGANRIKGYRERLSREYGQAILTWLVQGCVQWLKQGLGEPQEVLEAIRQYRDAQDILHTFLTEECFFQPSSTITVKELYKYYKQWCDETDSYCLGKNKFGIKLIERGLLTSRGSGNKKIWRGIRLLTDEEKVTLGNSVTDIPLPFLHEGDIEEKGAKTVTKVTKVTDEEIPGADPNSPFSNDLWEGRPNHPTETCHACGGSDFWPDFKGKRFVCSRCHPRPQEIDMEG